MNDELSMPALPPVPLGCEGFLARLHFRRELAAPERLAFDRHAATCRPCAQVLLEAERLDDLLLQWQPPADSAAAGPAARPRAERILRAVQGEAPTASCAEATASLHHFVAGDLEPWLAARVERHLARCKECAEQLDEAGHSRKLWLGWKAPDPAADFAERLIRRLEPQTRAARRRRLALELLFGPVRVPRAVAALVLTSITLLSIGVLQLERGWLEDRPARTAPERTLIDRADAAIHSADHRASLPTIPLQYTPAGRGDPTDSLSPDVRAGRPRSLRSVLRGEDGGDGK